MSFESCFICDKCQALEKTIDLPSACFGRGGPSENYPPPGWIRVRLLFLLPAGRGEIPQAANKTVDLCPKCRETARPLLESVNLGFDGKALKG